MNEEIKISQLQEANEINENDLMMIIQNGVNKKKNIKQMAKELGEVAINPTQPTTNEKVWFKKGKNLFNKDNNIIKGYSLNDSGGRNPGADYFYGANYISVKPNTTYTIQQGNADTFRVCEYTADKTFVKRDISSTMTFTFTTGSTTYFVRISSLITNLDSLQLELGSTASSYEAYIEPTVFVKNGSIFEEFVKDEALIKYGAVANPDSSVFSITRSNVVQIDNIVFVDLSIQLLAEVPAISQYQFRISGVKSTPRPIFPLASYGESDEFKANEIIYGSMINDILYLANDKSKSLKNGFWKIHFSYPII